MTFGDAVAISFGNLWRKKLRTTLTMLGIVIAIAAFTGMVSFGVGNQMLVEEEFERLDLLSTMIVYPPGTNSRPNHDDEAERPEKRDTAVTRVLNAAMVDTLAALPGVKLAYPFDAFPITVQFRDTTLETEAQALPHGAFGSGLFKQIVAGSLPEADTGKSVVVTQELLEMLDIKDDDSVVNETLIVSAKQLSLDSAIQHLIVSTGEHIGKDIRQVQFDSLRYADYRQRILGTQFSKALEAFSEGLFNRPRVIADTLVICGVLEQGRGHRTSVRPVVMPVDIADRLGSGGLGSDPADLLAAVRSGRLFESSGNIGKAYPRVTLMFDRRTPYEPLKDTVEALGFETFSFAEEFSRIRRFFFYFDLALAAVGLIALVTAAMGIINTMLMAITERTREIGVIKSLGADERDIRRLFLMESAVIGAIGSALGLLFGWLGTRILSAIAQAVMRSEGLEGVDLFATPLWLVAVGFVFGVAVSLLAGWYPSSRAARVDPVVALRGE